MKKIIATMLMGASAAALSVGASHAQFSGPITGLPGYTYVTAVLDTNIAAALNPTFTANVYEGVYRNNTTGFLAFVYQVQNNGASPLESLSGDGYSGFLTSVKNDPLTGGQFGLGGIVPTNQNGTVSQVPNFFFGQTIAPGQHSDLLIATTNTKYFVPGNINVIDSTTATAPNGFKPSSTPEASTMLPFGFVGLGLLGLIAARRKKAHATLA